MPPDRFDDVEFRMIEGPEQRPRRRRRWVAAGVGTFLVAGALAAGASALTGGDDPVPVPSSQPGAERLYHHRFMHHGGCHRHDRDRDRGATYAPDASKL
jgi:hypothetical protein